MWGTFSFFLSFRNERVLYKNVTINSMAEFCNQQSFDNGLTIKAVCNYKLSLETDKCSMNYMFLINNKYSANISGTARNASDKNPV